MGCDEAVLLSDRAFGGADTLATGYVLAKSAEKIGDYDLLIFGRHASDGETAPDGSRHRRVPRHPADNTGHEPGCAGRLGRLHARHRGLHRTGTRKTSGTSHGVRRDKRTALRHRRRHHEGAEETARYFGLQGPWKPTPPGAGIPGSPSVTKRLFEPKREKIDTSIFSGDAAEIARQFVDMLESQHLI